MTAGIAVVLSSTALTGVLQGYQWFWSALVSVGTVVLIGLLLRAARVPTVVVVLGQLVGLVMLLTGLFSTTATLWVLPGPDALGELAEQMSTAIGVIENGIPPVTTTPAMALLVAVAFGLSAVATDALAAADDAPAAVGLVLLGAFTVPTALTPRPLPSWTVAVGAAGFALVLLAQHRRRQAKRGVINAVTDPPRDLPPPRRALHRLRKMLPLRTGVPVATGLTAAAVAIALGAGAVFTLIGTEGRLPGNGHGGSDGSDGQLGLNPFTSLRGQLDRDEPSELFRVRGLGKPEYLRALTLNRYIPQHGWQLPDRYHGVNLDATLPSGLPVPVNNPTVTMQVENVNYRDQWLPLVGQPMGVTGVLSGRWKYDVLSGTAFTETPVREPTWTERAALPDPAVSNLRALPPATDVNPTYLDTGGVDGRIVALAREVTRNARSPFERVVAINRYFLDPANGFRYSLQTAPGNTGDALLDFLTKGKTGYCEQYASAMAVMLRAVGVPSRVAIGFTAGTEVNDYRSVSTSDAHAWVEAYFPGVGWLTFDPTPLRDGRTILPNYVAEAPEVSNEPPSRELAGQPSPPANPTSPPPTPPAPPLGAGDAPLPESPRPEPNQGQDGLAQPPTPEPGGGFEQGTPDQSGDGAPSQPSGGLGDGSSGGGSDGDEDSSSGGASQAESDDGGPINVRLNAALKALLFLALALLVIAVLVATPSVLRWTIRRHRLARVAQGGSAAATVAWRELLDEFQDRGGRPPENETVRATATHLAKSHRLDGQSMHCIRTVVGAVERDWYAAGKASPAPGPALVTAVKTVRSGLDRSSPVPWTSRLWPRSLRPRSLR